VISALLVAAAATVGLIIFLFLPWSKLDTKFLPFFLSEYQKPQVPSRPWAAGDAEAVDRALLFTRLEVDDKAGKQLTRDVMRDRLESLRQTKPGESVVIYLTAHASIDDSGAVQVLAYDADSYAPSTLLSLRELLAALKKCPAQNKLLVLDVMPAPSDSLALGGAPEGVADLVGKELGHDGDPSRPEDPRLMVLVSCSPGEYPLWSEPFRQSVFAHYFVAAFADPEADANGDRTISVKELNTYLAKTVDQWARQHRGLRQRPFLVETKNDFLLASLDPRRATSAPKDNAGDKTAEKDKASDKDKTAEKDKAPDTGKPADKEKPTDRDKSAADGPGKGSEQDAGKAAGPDEPEYPRWLAAGWLLREGWKGNDFQAAPRVFRRLEASLLRAELEWRSGKSQQTIQFELDKATKELPRAMDQAREIRKPGIRSVGQARAFGQQPDPALRDSLKDCLERRRKPGLVANVEEKNKLIEAAEKAVLEKLKGKKELDLAWAIVEAAREERFDTETVRFLDSLVDKSDLRPHGLPPQVVELRILKQLARRAAMARPGEWDDVTAQRVWDSVILAEEVNNRPIAFAWVHSLLDAADAQRHVAETLLLPEAFGFSSRVQIDQFWQGVKKDFEIIERAQDNIEKAQATLDRARIVLPALIPYLERINQNEIELLWRKAVEDAHDLALLLEKPGPQAWTGKRPEELDALDSQLNSLLRPFQPDALGTMIRRCGADRPEPGLAEEVEAILSTPFAPLQERAKLWGASVTLYRRLEQLAIRDGSSADTGTPEDRWERVRSLAKRRAQRLSALLELVGVKPSPEFESEVNVLLRPSNREASSDLAGMGQTWGGLAKVSRLFRLRLADLADQPEREAGDDHLAWIAPAFTLDLDSNPIHQGRERNDMAAWTWLADHYHHQSQDLRKLADPDQFFDTAAVECPGSARSSNATSLELELVGASSSGLTLSTSKKEDQADIRVVLHAADVAAAQSVVLEIIKPADRRLRVAEPAPGELKLAPGIASPATIKVKWVEDEEPQSILLPKGFIVQARLPDQRRYHLLVPITIVSERSQPRLALSTDPIQCTDVPVDPLVLRALPDRQKFYVFVKNPSQTERKVIVQIVAGDRIIARSGEKAIQVKPDSPAAVLTFGDPPPKLGEALPEAPPRLKLRLRDAETDLLLDEQELQPAIADPMESLEVLPPRFTPSQPSKPNRLEVTLHAFEKMTGPPCRVKLDIPSDRELFPAFLQPPTKSVLEGTLAAGKRLTLYAEEIKLNENVGEEGRFHLSIDGLQRVLWYKVKFAAVGEPQIATADRTPRVRFKPEIKPEQLGKLHVDFTVDNVPPNTRLQFRLGHYEGADFADDRDPWEAEAKRRHLGFDHRGEAGALLFEVKVEDRTEEFDIRQIRGPRRLQAVLRGPRDRDVLDTWSLDFVLDDLKPDNVELRLPDKVLKGKTNLIVRATASPPPSGIKEVVFIVGKEADFASAEAQGKIVKVVSKANDQSVWEATLALPKDLPSTLVVTACFTTGVGLKSFKSEAVNVVDPTPPPAEAEASKAEADKPGAIEGKVTENDVAQPALIVILIDPKAKDKENPVKDQKKTARDGTYKFSDLKPGLYRVHCEKDATGRSDTKDVTVESGKTMRQDLDLLK